MMRATLSTAGAQSRLRIMALRAGRRDRASAILAMPDSANAKSDAD